MIDYFSILGVPNTASFEVIKQSYRRLVKELHPDRTGNNIQSTEQFRNVQEAYEFLSNDQKRLDLSRKLNNKNKKKLFYNAEYQRIRMEEMLQSMKRNTPVVKKKSSPPIDNTFIDIYKKYYLDEEMPNVRNIK